MEKKFLGKYLKNLTRLALPTTELISALAQVKRVLVKASGNGNKIIIVGNGGSAAIASHFSVDLTKSAGIRCVNFNEAGLITCLANDYGHDHWIEKAVEFYGDEGNVLIAVSSSGQSENILDGCKAARKSKFSSVITFSGFRSDNSLRKMGDVNLWVDSKTYNFVESIHQLWLVAIVDLINSKQEYST